MASSGWPIILVPPSDLRFLLSVRRITIQRAREGNFNTEEMMLQQSATKEAPRLFGRAAEGCPKSFIEYSAANAELKALTGYGLRSRAILFSENIRHRPLIMGGAALAEAHAASGPPRAAAGPRKPSRRAR